MLHGDGMLVVSSCCSITWKWRGGVMGRLSIKTRTRVVALFDAGMSISDIKERLLEERIKTIIRY